MRIFVAGAAGAIGRQLVPMLVAAGHQVTGTTRDAERTRVLHELGAEPVVLDALDAAAVREAVGKAAPDVVVHQLTALTGVTATRDFDQQFAATNRLRTEGTDNLVAAAPGALVVAQSFAGWPAERTGGPVKTEDDPFDPSPGAPRTLEAVRHLERVVTDADGIALRYGLFYGPNTTISADGDITGMVRKRRLPLVGDGGGVWSFCHITDAARATVAAIDAARPGVYAITDDEPAPVREWLPALAAAVGAKPPRRVPAWLAKPLIGQQGLNMMTTIRGASNAKAKADLDWSPTYPTWREGFRTGL
jgi:2-alkyl-3-oxoalkanoate reductase